MNAINALPSHGRNVESRNTSVCGPVLTFCALRASEKRKTRRGRSLPREMGAVVVDVHFLVSEMGNGVGERSKVGKWKWRCANLDN